MILRLVLIVAILAALFVPAAAVAGGNGAIQGECEDLKYPQTGVIRYLGNKAGYHFWFTPNADYGPYLAGHSYHNLYKFKVNNPDKWSGPANVPNRAPYNIVATPGDKVYYKIFDTTTGGRVYP